MRQARQMAERRSRDAVPSLFTRACLFPTPSAAERRSRDAGPGRFHMREARALCPYLVRQSGEATMPLRVTFPRTRCARAPGAAERRSRAAAPGFFQRAKRVPWCPPG
jgi:hypothetical protein